MQIKGKLTGDVLEVKIRATKNDDNKTTLAQVDFTMTEKQAQVRLGDHFVAMAFSSLRSFVDHDENGDATEHEFMSKTITPTNKIVFSKHKLTFDEPLGESIDLQPTFLKIITIPKSQKVAIRLRLEIDVARRKLLQWLGDCCVGCEPVRVTFKPLAEPQKEMFPKSKDKEKGNGADKGLALV